MNKIVPEQYIVRLQATADIEDEALRMKTINNIRLDMKKQYPALFRTPRDPIKGFAND